MTKPFRKQTVHMVGRDEGSVLSLFGTDVATLCGKTAAPTERYVTGYTLTDSNGNRLLATTIRAFVSCQKCTNLLTIGALHVNTPNIRKGNRNGVRTRLSAAKKTA